MTILPATRLLLLPGGTKLSLRLRDSDGDGPEDGSARDTKPPTRSHVYRENLVKSDDARLDAGIRWWSVLTVPPDNAVVSRLRDMLLRIQYNCRIRRMRLWRTLSALSPWRRARRSWVLWRSLHRLIKTPSLLTGHQVLLSGWSEDRHHGKGYCRRRNYYRDLQRHHLPCAAYSLATRTCRR